MSAQPQPLEEDEDIRRALDWFHEVALDSQNLSARIRVAQEHYRAGSIPVDHRWPDTTRLLLNSDRIASYLAQADAILRDRRVYDAVLGSRILPFIKTIGSGVDYLRHMEGAADRVRGMLNSNNDHPDSALFELTTAVRYAREPLNTGFILESDRRMADLRVSEDGLEVHIECKRLRPSIYELRESGYVRALFESLEALVHERGLSVHIDVNFTTELAQVPNDYLVEHVQTAITSRLLLADGYPWSDGLGEGVVRPANVSAVRADTTDSSLLFGPKMARLLTGQIVSDGSYLMAASALPRREDPRYIDLVRYASALTWHCLAPASIEARARHVRSKLADISNQLTNAPMGIAHIGMDAERDPVTADLRRQRNLDTVLSFQPSSPLVEVELHYFLPRVSEVSSWMIDETVDTFSLWGSLLGDARILGLGEPELEDTRPAWHMPPPPLP